MTGCKADSHHDVPQTSRSGERDPRWRPLDQAAQHRVFSGGLPSRKGTGKRGGVRVVYFNRLANGVIWLLLIYAKSVQDNIPAAVLRELKQEIENADV